MGKFSLLVMLAGVLLAKAVNGQSTLFTTYNQRKLTGYDINSIVPALNSFTAIADLACIYACATNANCALVILKTGSVCYVYSSSAISKVVITASSGSYLLYQKQTGGYIID
jgi:hypothetical protein